MRKKWMFIVPAAIAGIAIFTFLGGKIVESLWNWLMPMIFGLRALTFWQALGLLALCRILFGGFGMHRGSGNNSAVRQRIVDRMADRVAERWEAMNPEERERFRQRLRDKMGFDPASGENKAL